MANFLNSAIEYLETALRHVRSAFHPSRPWIARARQLGRSRRVRKIGVIVVAVTFPGLGGLPGGSARVTARPDRPRRGQHPSPSERG